MVHVIHQVLSRNITCYVQQQIFLFFWGGGSALTEVVSTLQKTVESLSRVSIICRGQIEGMILNTDSDLAPVVMGNMTSRLAGTQLFGEPVAENLVPSLQRKTRCGSTRQLARHLTIWCAAFGISKQEN